jgi:hypothetical protein
MLVQAGICVRIEVEGHAWNATASSPTTTAGPAGTSPSPRCQAAASAWSESRRRSRRLTARTSIIHLHNRRERFFIALRLNGLRDYASASRHMRSHRSRGTGMERHDAAESERSRSLTRHGESRSDSPIPARGHAANRGSPPTNQGMPRQPVAGTIAPSARSRFLCRWRRAQRDGGGDLPRNCHLLPSAAT